MNVLDAIELALKQTNQQPLHISDLASLVIKNGLWMSNGKTPEATIHARIANDIKYQQMHSRFQRTAKSTFALRAWGFPEFTSRLPLDLPPLPSPTNPTLTFTNAAECVLDQQANHAPMHYQQITALALTQDLLNTQGQTPEATMYAQVLTEIKRQTLKGETPRFTKHGQGLIGLTKWLGSGLLAQIAQHNAGVAKDLQARLLAMTPTEFEVLVGTLLDRMGFAVTITKPTSDGGVDVRGTLAVGGTMGVNMAVQVKRWKHNVSSPEVQKLRGSLMVHEQGLLVTTSGFSSGAKTEASKPNAIPVGLIDGKELIALLMRHQIGVRELPTPLYELEP